MPSICGRVIEYSCRSGKFVVVQNESKLTAGLAIASAFFWGFAALAQVGPTNVNLPNFHQVSAQQIGHLDMRSLAIELASLRREMRQTATEPEQDIAIGQIAAAEAAVGLVSRVVFGRTARSHAR